MKYFGTDRRKGDRREDDGRNPSDRKFLGLGRKLERRNGEKVDDSGRRQGDTRDAERRDLDRRQDQRRQAQRREFFRVVYPPDVPPKVLDSNYHIIDISCKGLRFYCQAANGDCQPPIKISQPLKLRIQFHDQEIIELQGRILRCYVDPALGAKVYCVLLTGEGVSPKRINDEQRHFLKHYPDFYRTENL